MVSATYNPIPNAQLAPMDAFTIKGNNTNASAYPQDITASNVRSMIDAQETMQYTEMPETVTNGTIIQYIGETTIVAPIYTNGHFYKGVDGVWVEIVYGDPNSVSYDAQDKSGSQKAQARTNIGAADVAAFSAHYTNGVVDGLGLGTPATGSGSVDVAESLVSAFLASLGLNGLEYECGIWTPVLTYETVTTAVAYTGTLHGGYVKIGKLVMIRLYTNDLAITNAGAGTRAIIAGLPFNGQYQPLLMTNSTLSAITSGVPNFYQSTIQMGYSASWKTCQLSTSSPFDMTGCILLD